MSVNIENYIQLSISDFVIGKDYNSLSCLTRSIDAFNDLLKLQIKLTFRDMSLIDNIIRIKYFVNTQKWNSVGGVQYPLLISSSIVDDNYTANSNIYNQTVKSDMLHYSTSTSNINNNIVTVLKNTSRFIREIENLDKVFNERILTTLQTFDDSDGITTPNDYQETIKTNGYALLNEFRHFHPFRILITNLLDIEKNNNTIHLSRRESFMKYLNSFMDYAYEQNKDRVFFLEFTDDDAAVKHAGPLFFDISTAVAYGKDLKNNNLSENDILTQNFTNDYSFNFYSLSDNAGISGYYREYDKTDINNEFVNSNSSIYTLFDTYTVTSLVNLESFNSQMIPFHFIDGDILSFMVEYSVPQIKSENETNNYISSRKYKVDIKLSSMYYDNIESNNTYYVYYHRDKINSGELNYLGSLYSNVDSLDVHGWKFDLSYQGTVDTESIYGFYNSNLPHIKEAFNANIVYENTDNNCTYGVSDLKIGHIITPEFVIENSASNTFTWKTVNTNNPVDINDSVDISYYIQSGSNTENHDISNTGSVNINNQDEPIFVFQLLIHTDISISDFFKINIDTFTNNKRQNASGNLSYDYRIIMTPKIETFTNQRINQGTNLYLIYPPSQISSFQQSNNTSINGYNNVFSGLYITNITKNEATTNLFQPLQWNTNIDISKLTIILSSHNDSNNTNSYEVTMRYGSICIDSLNSVKIEYQFFVT